MTEYTYKDTTSESLDALYQVTKQRIDLANGGDIPLSEVEQIVDEYLTGKIDSIALLDDIKNQLDWIGPTIDDINTAIAAIPGFNIPAGLQTILTGMLQNQKRILQIERRELMVWRFVINNVKYD